MAPSAIQEATNGLPVDVNGTKLQIRKDDIKLKSHEDHDLVLRAFRCLIADLCEQFKGGHPG